MFCASFHSGHYGNLCDSHESAVQKWGGIYAPSFNEGPELVDKCPSFFLQTDNVNCFLYTLFWDYGKIQSPVPKALTFITYYYILPFFSVIFFLLLGSLLKLLYPSPNFRLYFLLEPRVALHSRCSEWDSGTGLSSHWSDGNEDCVIS